MKRRAKQENRELKIRINQKNEIKYMENGLKDRYESVSQKRAYDVKIMKASQIKEEI